MREARWRISGGRDVTYGTMCNGMYTGVEQISARISLDWNWNVHERRAGERAAFAYIMSDGVLCTEVQLWFD
jgi:hypothetical protein